jgi:hypothetical protein
VPSRPFARAPELPRVATGLGRMDVVAERETTSNVQGQRCACGLNGCPALDQCTEQCDPRTMRKLLLVVVVLVGCGSKTPQESLVGDWLFQNADGTSGLGVTFNGDGSYVLADLAVTSSTSANAEVEKGTYTATDTMFTMVPSQWTCDGKDTSSTETYKFSGSLLVVSDSSGVVTLAPNNGPSTGTFAVTLGCFDASNNFTAHPLGPAN